MKQSLIIKEIIAALESLGTAERLEMTKYFMSTRQKVIGVSNPDLRAIIREIRGNYPKWIEEQWISLCKGLVAENIFECQVIAYEMIGRNKKLLSALRYEDLADLWNNLDNWASVDHFSVGIYGVLWGRGIVKDRDIRNLLKSENFWDRRVAVVSTVALNLKSRGGKGDTPRTLWVCEEVVDERQDMIQKALSWALRELSKRDPQAVENFLELHENRLSGRVLREVRHKLDFGTKN